MLNQLYFRRANRSGFTSCTDCTVLNHRNICTIRQSSFEQQTTDPLSKGHASIHPGRTGS